MTNLNLINTKYDFVSKVFSNSISKLSKEHERYISFKSAFENNKIPSAFVEAEGHFLEVNQAFADMLEYSHDELLRMTWMDCTVHEDVKDDLSLVEQCAIEEIDSYLLPKKYLTKTKKVVPALLSVTRIDEPNARYFFLSQVFQLSILQEALCKLTGRD